MFGTAVDRYENVEKKKCNSIKLRDYQQRGVDWMYSLHKRKVNGILADEMGLVITSWQTDLQKFGNNDFNIYTHHGNKEVRQEAFLQWYHKIKKKFNTNSITQVYVCLTTYEVAIKDEYILRKLSTGALKWVYLVVDEAHRLKNKDSLLFEILNRLHYGRRLLLTGTPLQNNLAELWALLSFILPNQVFNTKEDIKLSFQEQFEYDSADDIIATNRTTTTIDDNTNTTVSSSNSNNNTGKSKYYSKLFRFLPKHEPETAIGPAESPFENSSTTTTTALNNTTDNGTCVVTTAEKQEIIAQIHALLKPYLLRRVKSDVAVEIPPKIEKVVYCPLSGLQTEVYQRFRHSVLENAYNKRILYNKYASNIYGPYEKALTNVNNLLIQLRKLCNHPYLVLEDVNTIPDALYYEHLIQASGKMFVLDKILTQLLEQKSKVLIFSQMTSMLDILQGYLQLRGVRTARLDGNTAQEQRETQLKAFNSPLTKSSPRRRISAGINSSSNSINKSEEEETVEGTSTTATTPPSKRTNIKIHTAATPTSPIQLEKCSTAPVAAAAEDDSYSVFLLSTRAGGVGINLQAADTVILFDSDWNPQQDLQAISRAHRIGQNKTVLVLRLVSIGPDDSTYSVEQRILRRATKKLEIGQQILADGMFDYSHNNYRPSASESTSKASTYPIHSENSSNINENQSVEFCDTIYSLFETITDTESVSSTASILPVSVDSSSTMRSDHPSASVLRRSHLTKQQDALINMYKLNFSSNGIDSICNRETHASSSTTSNSDSSCIGGSGPSMTAARDTTIPTGTSAAAEGTAEVEELRGLMGQCDMAAWHAWLDPPSTDSQDPDSHTHPDAVQPSNATHSGSTVPIGTEVDRYASPSRKHRMTRNNTNAAEFNSYLDEEEGLLLRANGKRKNNTSSSRVLEHNSQRGTGKPRARASYNEDEAWRMLLGEFKKNRRGDIAAATRVAEVAERKRKRKTATYITVASSSSDSSSSSSDSFHSSSNNRDDNPSRPKKKSPSDHPSGLQPDDICTICGQAWVTSAELDIYLDCKMQRQLERYQHQLEHRDIGNSPTTSLVEVSESVLPQCDKSDPSELLNMMLLCDGCNGSYHMICVGVDTVTDGAWYCQLCKYVS